MSNHPETSTSTNSKNFSTSQIAKSSHMQSELVTLQTEALNYTRRLRSDIGIFFQHAAAGIQQPEQESTSSGSQKSVREQFMEQLRVNQSSITKDYSELLKCINLILTKANSFTSQMGPNQNVPIMLLSNKFGDDNQHSAIKVAGASSPTVFNRYQQMLNSAISCEQLELNAAAIHEALPNDDLRIYRRRDFSVLKMADPAQIECNLKDHSKDYNQDGVTYMLKAFLEHHVVHVRFEKVCNIYFFIKDSQIEKTNCIGLNEIEDDCHYTSDRIHLPSKYNLFRQLALFVQSYYFSALKLLYPPTSDEAILKTLRMLRHYKDFLTEDCAKCGRITLHGLPPLCIDYGMLETDKASLGSDVKIPKYHIQCFPGENHR